MYNSIKKETSDSRTSSMRSFMGKLFASNYVPETFLDIIKNKRDIPCDKVVWDTVSNA